MTSYSTKTAVTQHCGAHGGDKTTGRKVVVAVRECFHDPFRPVQTVVLHETSIEQERPPEPFILGRQDPDCGARPKDRLRMTP